MPFLEGRVGVPGPAADNTVRELRLTKSFAMVVADAHARYREAVSRGNVFIVASPAAVALSVALATTYTGLIVSNPIGNGKLFSLLGAGFALSVAPAAIASLHLIGGGLANTDVVHTTPLAAPNIRSTLLPSPVAPSAKADSAATIVNPSYLVPLLGGFTAAAFPSSGMVWADLGGLFELAPGGYAALGALTAVTGLGALVWEEIPAS